MVRSRVQQARAAGLACVFDGACLLVCVVHEYVLASWFVRLLAGFLCCAL
eukprot:m.102968 g.102968  ORF g.102968 m.102968 type:complete len:50 (+) comp15550_c1_seq3:342-491(+)